MVNWKRGKNVLKLICYGQEVPHDIYCIARAMLKIGSVYKQCKTNHLQVYVEERKGNDVENWKYNMLRDSHDNDNDDDGYFEV